MRQINKFRGAVQIFNNKCKLKELIKFPFILSILKGKN